MKLLPKLTIGLFLQFILFIGHSQKSSYASISLGTSVPLPPFSSDDTKNKNSGLAKIGGVIQLKYVRKIPKERFGIAVLLTANMNGLKTNSMINSYYENNPQPLLNWQKKVNGWKTISIQPGFIYSFSLNKKIEIETGLYPGVAYAKSPSYSLKGKGSGSSFGRNYEKEVVFEQDKAHAFSFTTSLQSGLRLSVNERLDLIAALGYNYLKPTFKNVEQRSYGMTIYEPGGPANTSIYNSVYLFDITQNMNTINLNVGFVYRF